MPKLVFLLIASFSLCCMTVWAKAPLSSDKKHEVWVPLCSGDSEEELHLGEVEKVKEQHAFMQFFGKSKTLEDMCSKESNGQHLVFYRSVEQLPSVFLNSAAVEQFITAPTVSAHKDAEKQIEKYITSPWLKVQIVYSGGSISSVSFLHNTSKLLEVQDEFYIYNLESKLVDPDDIFYLHRRDGTEEYPSMGFNGERASEQSLGFSIEVVELYFDHNYRDDSFARLRNSVKLIPSGGDQRKVSIESAAYAYKEAISYLEAKKNLVNSMAESWSCANHIVSEVIYEALFKELEQYLDVGSDLAVYIPQEDVYAHVGEDVESVQQVQKMSCYNLMKGYEG
jgi:hypothetical protein